MIEFVQFHASVKKASSNKLSIRKGIGEQHDIRIGWWNKKRWSCCFPLFFTLLLKGINGIAHSIMNC